MFHPVIKAGREARGRCGAFGEYPGGVRGARIAPYLEGQYYRFQILQGKFLFDDTLDLPRLSAASLGDFAGHCPWVEFLADGDAAAQAPFPPPVGRDASKVVLDEPCRFVGQELVEVLGHRIFISVLLNGASRALDPRLSYTDTIARQREGYENHGADRQPPSARGSNCWGLHTCRTSPRVIRVGGRAMSENISKEEYALFLSQEGS